MLKRSVHRAVGVGADGAVAAVAGAGADAAVDVVAGGPAPGEPSGRLREATEAEFYTAKRKAAAVLGHTVRPGDLPSCVKAPIRTA